MSRTTTRSPIYDEPAYRAPEAAHILGLPSGTVQAWCFGHDYRHRHDGNRKLFARVIEPADERAIFAKTLSHVLDRGAHLRQLNPGMSANHNEQVKLAQAWSGARAR